MKRTVILSPYKKEFSGTAVFSDRLIRLTVNHPVLPEGSVLKLYSLSTSRAAAYPRQAGCYEPTGVCTEIASELPDNAAEKNSPRPEQNDTYLITVVTGHREEAAAAAFFGLEWNAARFLTGRLPESEEPTEEPKDNTLENAQNILDSMKKGNRISLEKINGFTEEFKRNIQRFEKCSELAGDGFEWYRITAGSTVSRLSAVKHVLSAKAAERGLREAGYYIAGIKKEDCRHIAIGIPGCRHVCPMPQLSDCCSFESGYHITGIYLGDDGQYFEKYLQKDK